MFVLPDFQKIMKGYIKSPDSLTLENEQILTLETERFSVPEVLRLFNLKNEFKKSLDNNFHNYYHFFLNMCM